MKTDPQDQPLYDAVPVLVNRANVFLKTLGLNREIEVFSEPLCDPRIEFKATGIGVAIFWGDKITIFGKEEEIKYGAFATTYDPGVRYHSDGSGTPPSEDVVELGDENSNMDEPLIVAIQELVKQELYNLTEAEADRATEAAEAELEGELEAMYSEITGEIW